MKLLKKDISIFLLILLATTSFMLIRSLYNLDEIWNYSFAKNIAEGLLPYKDFNMITMPLFPAIEAIFLNFIANELIITRIIGILIFTGIAFLSYKILNNLIENKWIPIISIIAIIFMYSTKFWANYNWVILLITMFIIFVELIHSKEKILSYNIKYDFITGVIVGLAIITKQTTGLILALTYIMYKFLFVKNKQDFKIAIKIFLIRGLGAILPNILFIIYLFTTNSMSDFIDYAIKGISTFSSTFSYRELITTEGVTQIPSILFPVLLGINFLVFLKNQTNTLSILTIFSLQNVIVLYPLCDSEHFLIAFLPTLLTTIYILNMRLEKYIVKFVEKLLVVVGIVLIVFTIVYSFATLYDYSQNLNNNLNHFNGIPIKDDVYRVFKELSEYILKQEENGNEVYILDVQAALPMILIDKYHKNYDLLIQGNLGTKGEDGIIDDIKQKKNALFLIPPEATRNRQNAEKVRSYVQQNYPKTGRILIYDIHKNM